MIEVISMSPELFDLRRYQFLQNPVWFVITITALSGLMVRLGFLQWLVVIVALVWGGWLIWHQFNPDNHETNHEDPLQDYLKQSAIYQAQIDQALHSTGAKGNPPHRQELLRQINIWVAAIQNLVQRITALRADELIRQDLIAVPQAVEALQAQLAQETDAVVREELRHALANRQHQLTALEHLQTTVRRAEIQVENTLSLLGTIYSQLLTNASTNPVADYSRLTTDIEEELLCLQDQLEALLEVKGQWALCPHQMGGPV
jgi:hypothetical protein